MAAKLYKLTDGDKAIFAAMRRENKPSRITSYYLRNEDSGTYWRNVTQDQIDDLFVPEFADAARRWLAGYEQLHDIWCKLGKPDFFGPEDGVVGQPFTVVTPTDYQTRAEALSRVYRTTWEDSSDPVFHHPHGALSLPWQDQMWTSKHPIQVVVGGFGSGKTFAKLIHMLIRAITLRGYRGFALAPYSIQSTEVYKQALSVIEGTYFERFLIAAPSKPYPHLVLGNDQVGRNVIECYPVLDDPTKLRTLTGDEVLLDQAERMEDLDSFIRDAGTRLRGQVRGRPRLGQIALVANADDNPILWDWFDEAQVDPKYVWSYAPATHENFYLTVPDLYRFQRQVGRGEQARKQYLFGGRPIGGGEHFPQKSLLAARAEWLDERMEEALQAGEKGWVREEAQKVGVHRWEMPSDPDGIYIVAADPGWSDPPFRNSPAIAVWKIGDKKSNTMFPNIPAQMVAFAWVYGGGDPNPWMEQFTEYCIRYKAIGQNGFDSTGFQSGYERLTDLKHLLPTPVQLTGGKKYIYLTHAKKIMADGNFQIPNIPHLFSQCAKYKLPDEKLRQDIVSMLFVTAALLEPYLQMEIDGDEDEREYDPEDRWDRPELEGREAYHER